MDKTDAIFDAGAAARAAGLDLMVNPYLKTENMPVTTGESTEAWLAKHDRWHAGWSLEDAVRAA